MPPGGDDQPSPAMISLARPIGIVTPGLMSGLPALPTRRCARP